MFTVTIGRDARGEPIRMFGAMQDVSELSQARRSLEASEERFRDIAEASSDWFWEMGPDLKISYVTESVREIMGIDPQALIGKSRRELGAADVGTADWQKHLDDLENH